MARAIASRCCSPPESVTGLRLLLAEQSHLVERGAHAARGLARGRSRVMLSGSTTLSNTLRSKSSLWSWKISPKLRRRNGIARALQRAHVLAVDDHACRWSGRSIAADQLEQRALARARMAGDEHHLAALDGERDVAQRLVAARVALGDAG